MGDVFSRMFEKPLGVLFTSSYREAGGTRQNKLVISEHMSSAGPLPAGKWLLVDDLVDSGATLTEVVPLIRARYPEVTRVAFARSSGARASRWPSPITGSSTSRAIPGFTNPSRSTITCVRAT